MQTEATDVYAELGIKRIINGMGNVTLLGGSRLSPEVQKAMDAANDTFVEMRDLLRKSGRAIADLVGAEDAFVTSGCFAALVLGIAGVMTGADPENIARLPDAAGMKNEFLIQKPMRYHYDRCISVPGGTVVEVGSAQETTAVHLQSAIGPHTGGILYFARMDGAEGVLPLAEVIRIAQENGVPVIVDAAAEVYPLDYMRGLVTSGADLVCFGAKYVGAAHSSGILCGRRERVEAAFLNSFTAYETERNRTLGRGYKVDRQEIVGTLFALREWMNTDHEERLRLQEERIQTVASGLAGLPHVTTERTWDTQAWMRLRVRLDEASGKRAADVAQVLREGEPSIWVRVEGDDLFVVVHTLNEGEDRLVAERLRQVLSV